MHTFTSRRPSKAARAVVAAGIAVLATSAGVLAIGTAANASTLHHCAPTALRADYKKGGGAGGTLYGDIVLTNRSSTACTLRGFASGYLESNFRQDDARSQRTIWTGQGRPAVRTLVLRAHSGSAVVRVGILSADNFTRGCKPALADSIQLTLPGSRRHVGVSLAGDKISACTVRSVHQLDLSQFLEHRTTTTR